MTVCDKAAETSLDGFLDNSFQVIQPKKGAHRSGMDAVLLASVVPKDCNGAVADFGAGSGVAGMAVAQRCTGVNVDLIEIDPASVAMVEQSLALSQNAHLQLRVKAMQADLSLTGTAREKSGLPCGHFDQIICNPPYNSAALQTSPDEDRARAHVMEPGLLLAWMKTAAYVAKPKAVMSVIIRPDVLPDLLVAFGTRFGSVEILPLHPKEKAEASRVIVQARKGGKGGLKIRPGFVLHRNDGSFTDEAEEIFRGRAQLPLWRA